MTRYPSPEIDDLMDRVREADPVTKIELEEEERGGADTLLRQILAEPGPHRHTASWARLKPAVAAAVCLALAALVATDLVDRGSDPTIADRAYAAVTDDQVIYHYVLDTRANTSALPLELRRDLDLANGRLEGWYRSDGSAFLSRQFRRDRKGRLRLYYESAQDHGRGTDYDPERGLVGRYRRGEPGARSKPIGPLDEFRKAYRDGKVLERGKAIFRGRPAYRLLIRRVRPGALRQRMTFYVDRKTYLPLGTRERTRLEVDGRSAWVRSEAVYKVYERLRDTRANRKALRMSPRPRARRVDGPAIFAP